MNETTDENSAAAGQAERRVRPCAWAVVYGEVTHGVCLTETAAKLWVENLLEQNRGRGFDFRVAALYDQAALESAALAARDTLMDDAEAEIGRMVDAGLGQMKPGA